MELSNGQDWKEAYRRIATAIGEMVWPLGNTGLRIPRIVTVKKGESYTDLRGSTVVAKRDETLRNGVPTLKTMFRSIMHSHNWQCERSLTLAPYFENIRNDPGVPKILRYLTNEKLVGLNESVGDFDFWDSTESGFRTVIEWETGNISSSHRSSHSESFLFTPNLATAPILCYTL